MDSLLGVSIPRQVWSTAALLSTAAISAYLYVRPALVRDPSDIVSRAPKRSPKWTVLPGLTAEQRNDLPYPPDLLPGARDVETPYGSLRVYEWGETSGEKVLLLHGIGTPCVALSEVARALVDRGYRVMLFDFFGRGYSDAPTDLPYDIRLYTTQIHLAISSSHLAWSGTSAFHLVGYSLGGGIAVSFARYHPHLVRSLALVAPAGLIRPRHVSWKTRLLYSEGYLPEWLLQRSIKQRLWPTVAGAEEPTEEELVDDVSKTHGQPHGDSDATGGSSYDNALLARDRPDLRVSGVIEWQLKHHGGYVAAYKSTICNAPIYNQREGEWKFLRPILEARRGKAPGEAVPPGLEGGKVLLVTGETDPVVIPSETHEDARKVLGHEAVDTHMFEGVGHEVGITWGREVANVAAMFWSKLERSR